MKQSERKKKTTNAIVESALGLVMDKGFDGVGVDGIAKSAGVTSGAIYGNFGSKGKVFELVVFQGMQKLIDGLAHWKENNKEQWLEKFIDWYVSDEHIENRCGGCALPGLSQDIARVDDNARTAFENQLRKAANEILESDEYKELDESLALFILTSLAGAVNTSRAVVCSDTRKKISQSCSQHLKHLLVAI